MVVVLTYVIPESKHKASKQHKNGTPAHTGQLTKVMLQCYEIKTYTQIQNLLPIGHI